MSFLSITILLVTAQLIQSNKHLKWMSFYDFDPVNQYGWSYGICNNLNAINNAYLTYNMSSMFQLKHAHGNITDCEALTINGEYPIFYSKPKTSLCPQWLSNLQSITSILKPFIINNTVNGYFIGDELYCEGNQLSFSNLSLVITELRELIGNDVIIYTNECAQTFWSNNTKKWKSIPDGLNWISFDYYNMINGTDEYIAVREQYENNVFPLLVNETKYGYSQKVILVPGTFSCNSSNEEIESNSQQIVIALDNMFEWSKNETRIVGYNPWHFDNRSSHSLKSHLDVTIGCQPGVDQLNTGAIAMPDVLNKLKHIGEYIMVNG